MPQELVVTVLTDNARTEGLCSEWGLSLHVRHGATSVLLDFGQSDAFARNASVLGIDLSAVDVAVLSHAHYDHSDGMETFFACNDHAPLHLSATCAETCWSTKGGTANAHYIGMKPGLLERFAKRLSPTPTDRVTTIAPGVHVVPHRTPGLAKKGERDGMLLHVNDAWHPDDFSHEVSLVFELEGSEGKGVVVCNSCSHAGLDVIVSEVQEAFPGVPIAAFVGGLHLFREDDAAALAAAKVVEAAHIQQVWAGHCTGDHAIELLAQELPTRVHQLRPGRCFSVALR